MDQGFRHEALIYSSEEEFLAVAAPFVGDAVAAGRPAVVSLPRALERLLLDAPGSAAGLTLEDGGACRPVRLLAGLPAHGAPDACPSGCARGRRSTGSS